MNKPERFIQLIQQKLDENEWSVPQFAAKVGVPRMTAYNWLNRVNIPTLEMYYRILEVLGINDILDDRVAIDRPTSVEIFKKHTHSPS